jgi:hypothetical protein
MMVMIKTRLILFLTISATAHSALAQDTAPAPVDPRKTEAEILTAEANARKAKAEATKAEQDLYGSIVTAAGTRGTATVAAGAGSIEAAAVASETLSKISGEIGPQALIAYRKASARQPDADLPKYCKSDKRSATASVVLVTDDWQPDTSIIDLVDPALTSRTSSADDFKTRTDALIKIMKSRIDKAGAAKPAAGGPPAGGLALPVIAAGFSALMGAMKTEVDFAGVTLSNGDAILLRTAAGRFKTDNPGIPVYVPAIAGPARGPGKALLRRLTDLDAKLAELVKLQSEFGALTAQVNGLAADAGEKTPLATTYGNIAKDIALARGPLDAFVTAQLAWLAALSDTSKGKPIAQTAAEQAEIGCIQADGGLLAQLKADAFGGSIFTRRNFWTNFGGTPIFVSAGGVVTFSFTDLQNGDFINSGVASSMGKWSPIIQAGPRGRVSTINFQTPPVPPEAPK